MLPVEYLKWGHFLILSLSNPRKNAEVILKTRELFIHEEVYTLCKKMLKRAAQRRIRCESHFFHLSGLHFFINFYYYYQYICYPTLYINKYTGTIMHIIVSILIHSSFCVLQFTLPAWKQNFARVAYTTHRGSAVPSYDNFPQRISPNSQEDDIYDDRCHNVGIPQGLCRRVTDLSRFIPRSLQL
jgi:hypothetical protein